MTTRRSNAALEIPPPLTPDARLERAKLLLAENISELVAATLAKSVYVDEWVDQSNSPLGRRRHCTLVRDGKLKATRDGRRVLVRKVDIENYLAKQRVIVADDKADEDREVARVLAQMGRKASGA